jgi:hypothetical protein
VSPKISIAAGLLALVASQAASASDLAYAPGRYRPQAYVFSAPDGPTVVPAPGCCQVVVPGGRLDQGLPPVPVAEVMNGGGFGFTGFDYYNDQITEGRFGARKRPKQYVIAPAFIDPPRY